MASTMSVAIASVASLLCAMVLIASFETSGVEAVKLLRDPAAEYGTPVYAGLISWLGVSALVTTSAVTALGASASATGRGLLLTASVFSALLALDDALMFHERFWENELGLREEYFFLLYGVALVLIARSLWREPPPSGWTGILIPTAFLTASVLIDAVSPRFLRGPTVGTMEDLAKLAGFVGWAAYWSVTSRAFLVADLPRVSRRRGYRRPRPRGST